MTTLDKAKLEFLKLGYKPIDDCEDDPDKWIQENVLELLDVFSKQGHSGMSAPYVISLFKKLANHEPLSPITCEDDEWYDSELNDDTYQNKRCSAVFKHGKDGKPNYLDAIVWRDVQDDCNFTGRVLNSKNEYVTSSQDIKLPFTPKKFYIDVIETEIAPGDNVYYIKDESQLKEVWQYYEKRDSLTEKRFKKLKSINEK